jgi:hypothetical protein
VVVDVVCPCQSLRGHEHVIECIHYGKKSAELMATHNSPVKPSSYGSDLKDVHVSVYLVDSSCPDLASWLDAGRIQLSGQWITGSYYQVMGSVESHLHNDFQCS